MIKIIRNTVVKGGSLVYQSEQIEKAFSNLQDQLNNEGVKDVLNLSFNENDSDIILVAVVRIDVPSNGKSKKGGK